MHLTGGLANTDCAWRVLRQPGIAKCVGELQPIGMAAFLVSWSALAAVVWEFREWFTDRYLGTHAQGSVDDTMLDLAMGMLGGGLYSLWVAVCTATVLRENRRE